MKRQNDEHISTSLKKLMGSRKLKSKHLNATIREQWRREMGEYIDSMTQSISISRHTATIRLHSSALRHELTQNKDLLVKRLNVMIGETDYIKEVRLS